ncbi:MAG TPA: Clp protease ClpP, partial [Puia sp.]|nr:Clp protease ClpP [Puia sp.]
MLLDKHIGYDEEEGPGIDGALFSRELLELDAYCVDQGKKVIEVWINSPGGIVADGYAIYNSILATKTKVDTRCVGMACSIAAVIFQAGRQRLINDYGFLMYHNPFGGDTDDGLEAMKESIIKMISTRSGMSIDDVTKMMKATTFLTADEALAKGLADVIIPSDSVNVKRKTPSPTNVKQHWREFSTIVNSILNKSNMNLLKVTNKLGLNDAASEDNIVTAITEIQNKADKAEKDKKDLQDKLDKMEKDLKAKKDEYDTMKGDYEKCKNDLEEMDKKNKEKEAADKKEKA